MGSNRKIRKKIEQIYGKGCMFLRAGIANRLSKIKGIETYEEYKQGLGYTDKKEKQLEDNMTLHHLKHKSEKGPSTVDNGGEVGELPHRYLHELPRQQEEVANEMIRQFKYNVDAGVIVPTEDGDLMGESKVKPFVPYTVDVPDTVSEIPKQTKSKNKSKHQQFVDKYKVKQKGNKKQQNKTKRRKERQQDRDLLREINYYEKFGDEDER